MNKRLFIIDIIVTGVLFALCIGLFINFLKSDSDLSESRQLNTELRAELTSAREEVDLLRDGLIRAAEENLELERSLTASEERLGELRAAIDRSLASSGELEEENLNLLATVRECLQIVREIERILREDGVIYEEG